MPSIHFADAEASFDQAAFVIYGYPDEGTVCFRQGTAQAPAQIRHHSENFETFLLELGLDLKEVPANDYGDIELGDDRAANRQAVTELVTRTVKAGKVPIGLGGEHSLTPAAVEGLKVRYPDLAVVVLDAHLDFRDEYQGHSHSHASTTRRLADLVGPENLAVVGLRSASRKEISKARQQGLRFIDSSQMNASDIRENLADVLDWLNCDNLYLSLDMDVIDPAFAPGVGTPEPFGLTPFEIIQAMNFLSDRLVGLDCVEVCPPFDNGNTSALAARLVRHFMGCVWQARGGASWTRTSME